MDAPVAGGNAVSHELLEGLDPEQRAAVSAPPGPVVVHAAAGSGKTTVLTRRIAWRIAETGASPEHVLAITFTRQAAGELRRRLAALGAGARETGRPPTAGTFHAVGYSLLRQRCLDTGKRVPVVVTNRSALLSAVLERSETSHIPDIIAAIDWAHVRSVPASALEAELAARKRRTSVPAARLARIMADYEALKARRGVVDLDDMLTRVVDAAAQDSVFLDSVRWQFRHLHVDEAQDMNPLQHRFLTMLIGGSADLFAVGDPNQAIYMWNGAEPGLFAGLADMIPGTRVMPLGSNYRCTPQVVAAAVGVLGASGQRAEVSSRRTDGEAVRWVRCADEDKESKAVVAHVRGAHDRGIPWGAIAVLARTNALASSLSSALEHARIPVRTSVGTRGILDAIAEASSLGGRDTLRAWSSDVLDRMATPSEELGRTKTPSEELGRTKTSSDAPGRTAPASDDVDEPDEADDATVEVARHVRDFLAAHPVGAVDGRMFATWLRTQDAERAVPGVEVMSIHAAKGREWTAVVLAGMENGLLPISGATGASALEEARLAYVALTRASDRLVVTWTDSRAGKRTGPSPLLRGIDLAPQEPAAPGPEVRETISSWRRERAPSRTTLSLTTEALELWRARQARAAGVAPGAVLTDAEMRRLAEADPRSVDDVVAVIGSVLGNRHGPRIVAALSEARDAGSQSKESKTGA